MQLSKRMGRGSNNPSDTIDFSGDADVELSRPVHNPLQPSSAYLQSQKRSRDVDSSTRDNNPVNHHVRPGLRTIASAIILFVGGIILLVIGSVIYSETSTIASKGQGLDILIIGAVSKS